MTCRRVSNHPGAWTRVACLVACGLVCTVLAPQARAAAPNAAAPAGFQRVLILGNSITLHGPKPSIGWTSNWGMAASAPEKDFVHIVARSLAGPAGNAPQLMVKNIVAFERQYASYDVADKLKEGLAFQADLVILAIGENTHGLNTPEARAQFEKSVEKLLQELKAASQPTIIVRSCFWPNRDKDQALKQACQAVGGTFVDISALSKNKANFARSEREFAHAGVAGHPGDRGMQAIADAILTAIGEQQRKDAPQ